MPFIRRSLTFVVVSSVALGGLTLGASASEDSIKSRKSIAAEEGVEKAKPVARGLIVKTVSGETSRSLLDATDKALGSKANVASADGLTGTISTIDFDELVSGNVAAAAAAEVAKRKDVLWAVPNSRRQTSANPPVSKNDTHYAKQRNLWDVAAVSPVGGYSIKAPAAWKANEGEGVTVAVVDTGILKTHPELDGQLVAGYDMISEDVPEAPSQFYTAGDGNGRDADETDPGDWVNEDDCGFSAPSSWHGTFVAGQIGAKTNNSSGIAGAAPGVKIQPVRALGHCGGYDSDIIAGLTWASGGDIVGVDDNPTPAQVVNLSLGGAEMDMAARDAACVAYEAAAYAGNARGSIFVAAVGNDAEDAALAVPASCDGFLAVGATSLKGYSAWYSNFGPDVDISAPGGDMEVEGTADSVFSLANAGTTNAIPGAWTYPRYEGTSMAAPHVSAGAAMLYSLGMDDPAAVTATLKQTVSPFHAYNAAYTDLNCAGPYAGFCGTGILDLSKIQAPVRGSVPTITGTLAVGEPLTAVPGSWTGSPTLKYTWLSDGAEVGTNSPTYTPTAGDVGNAISVRVAPTKAAYSGISSVSTPTAELVEGPEVTIETAAPAGLRFGGSWTPTVKLGAGAADGPVELRRGSTVLASGTTAGGTVDLTVAGTKWLVGANDVRAVYLGTSGAARSAVTTVSVGRAIPQLLWTLPTSVTTKQNAKMVVRIRVPGVPAPTGLIDVYDGSKKIMSFSMGSGYLGLRTVYLPKLKKGTHSIKFRYVGITTIAGATSTTKSLKVR